MGIVGTHPGRFRMSGKYRTYRRQVCMSGKQRTYSNGIFATMMEVERARGRENQRSRSIGLVDGTSRLPLGLRASGANSVNGSRLTVNKHAEG